MLSTPQLQGFFQKSFTKCSVVKIDEDIFLAYEYKYYHIITLVHLYKSWGTVQLKRMFWWEGNKIWKFYFQNFWKDVKIEFENLMNVLSSFFLLCTYWCMFTILYSRVHVYMSYLHTSTNTCRHACVTQQEQWVMLTERTAIRSGS